MRTFTTLFYILVGSALTIFIYSNFDQEVIVYFTSGFHTAEIPLALALLGSMIAGFLVTALFAFTHQFRLRNRLRHLRKTNEKLESEIAGLRNLPLTSLPAPDRNVDAENEKDRELPHASVD